MADDLLSVEAIEAMRPALHDARWSSPSGIASETVDALCDTAVAYHVKATDPTAAIDQLRSTLVPTVAVVAEHYAGLIGAGVPADTAQALTLQLHHVLLTAGGES